jgi:hypothetical protein
VTGRKFKAVETLPAAKWMTVVIRLTLGYLAAVATGTLIFAIFMHIWPGWASITLLPRQTHYFIVKTRDLILAYFVCGTVLGFPYTALGTFAFNRHLPKNMITFLIVGALCPASAIVLYFLMFGKIHWLAYLLGVVGLSLPAGFAAAYVFGAIGMGYGFRHWRFT